MGDAVFSECINRCVLYMTSVDDGFPLVEPALVRHGVEVAALGVSEGRQAGRTGCRAADPVPPPLPQAVLPPVLRTAETVGGFRFSHCFHILRLVMFFLFLFFLFISEVHLS